MQFYCPGILQIRMNDGGNNVNNCRCRDAKGHLKEIYTHFTCATDTTNIQVSPLTCLRGSDVPRVSYLLPDTSLICLMSDMSPISVSPKSWLQCQCLIVSDVPSVSGVSAHVSSVRVSADVSTLLELHVHKPPPFLSINQFIKFLEKDTV